MEADFTKQIEYLKRERERLASDLMAMGNTAQVREAGREGSPYGKREEEASDTFELEKRLALAKRNKEALAEVEHALQKHASGTYSLCDECGKPIEPARMEALPQASVCLNCKSKQGKMGRVR